MALKRQWGFIYALLALSLVMAGGGIWALRHSPTLFFDDQAITLREGIQITRIDDLRLAPTDLWKLPSFTSPRDERAWWQAQRRVHELLQREAHVVVEFEDRLHTSWQIIADVQTLEYPQVLGSLAIVFLVYAVYVVSAVTVFRRHPTLPGFLCSFFLASTALYMVSVAPVIHRPLFLDPSWLELLIKTFFVASTGQISLVHFSMIFPRCKPFLEQRPWLIWVLYGYAITISLLYFAGLISLATTLPFLFLWIFVMLASLGHSILKDPDEFTRKQLRLTFFALLLVSLFFVIAIVYPWAMENNMMDNVALFSLILPFSLILTLDNQKLYQDRIHVEATAREEKERIHRELHDTVLNDLASISIVAEGAQRFLNRDLDGVRLRLRQIKEYTADSSRQLRNFLWVIDDRQNTWEDIIDSLRRLGYDLLSARNVGFELETHGDYRNLPAPSPKLKHSLYQIFRETLINVGKHAQARRVDAALTFGRACVVLDIRDDGRGFDPQHIDEGRHGLRNIRRRIEDLKGELVIRSAAGAGSRVIVQLPL